MLDIFGVAVIERVQEWAFHSFCNNMLYGGQAISESSLNKYFDCPRKIDALKSRPITFNMQARVIN